MSTESLIAENSSLEFHTPFPTSPTSTLEDQITTYTLFASRLVITLAAAAGNTLVLTTIAKSNSLRQESHSHLYMVSLAIADLGVALIVMPTALYLTWNRGGWDLGKTACALFNSLDVFMSTVSLLQLAVMTFDRYLAVCHPFKYQALSRKYVIAMIAGCWTLPNAISFLPIMSGWHERDVPPNNSSRTVCVFDVNVEFVVPSSALSFFVPTVTIVTLNVCMAATAHRQARAVRAAEVSTRPQGQGRARSLTLSPGVKATRTVVLLTGMFLLCWMPFVVLNFYNTFCRCLPSLAMDLAIWCGYANSALNPFLYLASNVATRAAVVRLLTRRSTSVIHPSQ